MEEVDADIIPLHDDDFDVDWLNCIANCSSQELPHKILSDKTGHFITNQKITSRKRYRNQTIGSKKVKDNANHLDKYIEIHKLRQAPELDYDIVEYKDFFNYRVLECEGCKQVSLQISVETYVQREHINSQILNVFRYPNQSHWVEQHFYKLDTDPSCEKIKKTYEETVKAFNLGMYFVCVFGLRTLIEVICVQQGAKKGTLYDLSTWTPKIDPEKLVPIRRSNLEGKINALYEKNILDKETTYALHAHRFLGNEAAHEADVPKDENGDPDVKTIEEAINLAEIIMEQLYGEDLVEKEKRKRRSLDRLSLKVDKKTSSIKVEDND